MAYLAKKVVFGDIYEAVIAKGGQVQKISNFGVFPQSGASS